MFTRILVPTDFSEPSEAALDCAKAIALRFGASLHLVHIIDDPLVTGIAGVEGFVPEAPSLAAELEAEAESRLTSLVSDATRTRFSVTTDVLHGPAASVITETATSNGFDLIVMGTHGRKGLTHVILGSVAERVVRSASCPVLTVHAKVVAGADLATAQVATATPSTA